MKQYIGEYVTPYLKKYRAMIGWTIFFGTLALLSAAMLTFTSGYLISRTSERPETILMVYVPIVAVRTFGISRSVFKYVERLLGHNAVLKMLADMRVKLYQALEPQALFIRERFKTGDLLGAVADDIEHLQDVYIRTIFPTLIGLFVFVFAAGGLATQDPLFALIMSGLMLIVAFVYPLVSLYMLKKHQTTSKRLHSQLYESFTDALFGVTDWMISGRKKTYTEQFLQEAKASDEAEKKLDYWHQSRTFQLQLITGALVIIVGCWAGLQAANGHLTPTYIAAFTLVVMPIMEALIPISHAVERVPVYEESFRRLDAVKQQTYEEFEGDVLLETIERPVISVENVSYTYPGSERLAVDHVDLTIRPGEKIAILGRSGAGKSTLLQLILGLAKPTEGRVTIGDYESERFGTSIYDVVSVLNQKPYLFATSVANNIRLGSQEATDERIQRVVQDVQLSDYLSSLPNGLDTQMEETGQRFSGGERQRIALSRILLKDTPIVVLDEPTVGLDPATERQLLETMYDALEEKTVLHITHHLTYIEKMDRIVFMDEGRIAMIGSHEQLYATNERYRNLYELDRGL